MNNIYINNFPNLQQNALFENVNNRNDKMHIVTGYDFKMMHDYVVKQIGSSFISSLLVHDKIIINESNILDVIKVFDIDDLNCLVRMNLLSIIPNFHLNPVLKKEKYGVYKADFLDFGVKKINIIKGPLDYLEYKLVESKDYTNREINQLILNLDETKIVLNDKEIKENIIKELSFDLANGLIKTELNLESCYTDQIKREELFKILRLMELNKTLVISSTVNTKNFIVDGAIKTLIPHKFSPLVKNNLIKNGVEIFDNIVEEKGLPDLGELYIKKIITLDDILKIRENYQAKIFRYWFNEKDCNKAEIKKEIINSIPDTIRTKIISNVRWITTNVASLINPVAGLLASATDNYLFNKIQKGWHPNMFLDNKLKAVIDKRLKENEAKTTSSMIKKRFPNIGRNDPCYCGSGKKFKRCHGRIK